MRHERHRRSATALNPFARRSARRSGSPSDAATRQRPYRGDYNRVGQTTRDAWGGFLSGEGNVFDDIKLCALMSYDRYERSQDTDTDFTPDACSRQCRRTRRGRCTTSCGSTASSRRSRSSGTWAPTTSRRTSTTTARSSWSRPTDDRAISRRIYSQETRELRRLGRVRLGLRRRLHARRRRAVQLGAQGLRLSGDQSNAARPARPANCRPSRTRPGRRRPASSCSPITSTPDASAYAKYTAASRPATSTRSPPSNLDEPPADEEYNDAWEAGLRGRWFDRRADAGELVLLLPLRELSGLLVHRQRRSGRAARARDPQREAGGELRHRDRGHACCRSRLGAARRLEGLRLSANFGWLHGEYIDFPTTRES